MITEADRVKGAPGTPPSDDCFPEACDSCFQSWVRTWRWPRPRVARSDRKDTGARSSSPGAALAAHRARDAVALLHNHADVRFHELGHVYHLRGTAEPTVVTSLYQVREPS